MYFTASSFSVQEGISRFSLVNGAPLFSKLRTTSIAHASSSNWESMFKLEVNSEASSLIDLCKDLDWEACVEALRREASAAREKRNASKVSREIESQVDSSSSEEWDYKQAISDLRKRASFKVAEEMATKMNTQDMESTVSRLADHIFSRVCELQDSKDTSEGNGFSKAAAIILSIFTGFQGWLLANAETTETAAATPAVPSWLPAAVLGVPVATYLVFSVYRDKVNPNAKITDFFFALGAMLIVGNLITSATLGVRLY